MIVPLDIIRVFAGAVALVSTFIILACGSSTQSTAREFFESDKEIIGLVRLRLPNLERAIADKGLEPLIIEALKVNISVPAQGLDDVDGAEQDTQVAGHLRVTIGGMSKQHCEVARLTYAEGWGEGLASVDCNLADGQRPFELEDFLTPIMQATSGQSFRSEEVVTLRDLTSMEASQFGILSGGQYRKSIVTDTNCWSTAYEVLRRMGGLNPTFLIHVLPKTIIDDYMSRNKGYSRLLDEGETSQFGDYLLIRDSRLEGLGQAPDRSETIVHAAVLIDEGLVFERFGNSEAWPNRIVSTADSLASYQGPGVTVERRRLLKDLPDPDTLKFEKRTVESSEGVVYDTTQQFRSISLIKSESGRFRLP